MNVKTRMVVVLTALAMSLPVVYAEAEVVSVPSYASWRETEQATAPLQKDSQLVCGRLENGLSYMIRPTKEPAGRASVRLHVKTGSLNETSDVSGVSHFLEHLVFNGSRHYKRGEVIPVMQKLGLGFGGDANAYTSFLETVYMLDLPNLKEETVETALTIMRDFADGATLEDDAVEHERGIVVSELKARDSASYRAMVGALGQLLEGTRIVSFMPIGSEEVIRSVPAEKVREYYRTNYVPERMTFIVTGDVKPEEAEQWIRRHFSDMKKAAAPDNLNIGQLSDVGSAEAIFENPETASVNISMSVVDAARLDPDSMEKRVREFPLKLAMAMLNTRFGRMAKQQDSPFMTAGVGRETLFDAADSFELSTVSSPDQWRQAMARAEQEIRKAAQFGFQKAELRECVASLVQASQRSIDSWDTVSANAVAQALVASLGSREIFTSPQEDRRVLGLALQQVLSDPDVCRRALAAAFDESRVKLTMSGCVPQGVTKEDLRAAFEESRRVEVKKDAEAENLRFAYERIGEPGSIVSKKLLEDVGVTMVTLSNGVRVNLKPIDFDKGRVAVRVHVNGGARRLAAVPGLAAVAGSVMGRGGLEAHSMDDLERLMAGRNVSLGVGIDERFFTYSGYTNAADLELQCNLLAAAILYPGFRPEGETMLRRNLDSFYRKLLSTPAGAYSFQAPRLLFGEDSRFTVPTKEQVCALGVKDVKKVVGSCLQSGAMEVSIVGDFSVEEVLPVLERTFGAMPQRQETFSGAEDESCRVELRPWGQREFLRYDTELDKTVVTQVRPAGDGMDRHRNRRLQVLASIVRSKLFDGIRAELGESYSPTVRVETNSDFRNAALITTSSAGVKGNRVKVNTAMDMILADIGKGHITEADFDCAIRPAIAQAEKSLRSSDFWLASISRLQSEPDSLVLLRDMAEDLRSVTLEEIQELAKEIFGSQSVNHYFTVPKDYDETAATPDKKKRVTAA